MLQAVRMLRANHSRQFKVFSLEYIALPEKAFSRDEMHTVRPQSSFRLAQLPPTVERIEDLCRAVRAFLNESSRHVAVLLAQPRTLPFLLVCVQHVCSLLPPSRQSLLARTYLDYCDALTSKSSGLVFGECHSSRALHSFLRHWHRARTSPLALPQMEQARQQVYPSDPFSAAGVVLYGVTLYGLPQVLAASAAAADRESNNTCRLSVMIVSDQGIMYASPVSVFEPQHQAGAHFPMRVRMVGDAFLKLYHRSDADQSNVVLLTVAFHARFSSHPDRHRLRVSLADVDVEDHKLFPPSFAIELDFEPPAPLVPASSPAPAPAGSLPRGIGTTSAAGPAATGAGAGRGEGGGEEEDVARTRADRLASFLARRQAGPSGPPPSSEQDATLMLLMQAILGISLARNNPAPTELVRMLPVIRVAAGSTMASEECAICREQLQPGDPVRLLPCMHFYHSPCIDPWFELQDHCPVCKVRLCADTMQLNG
jgi:hypothetical protein